MSTRSSKKSIPEELLEKLEKRITARAKSKWPGCKEVAVRSRGAFAYVDARGKTDKELEPLCRLRYMGSIDLWEFAYFAWSSEKYEPSVLLTGQPFGSPEDCFDTAAFTAFPKK